MLIKTLLILPCGAADELKRLAALLGAGPTAVQALSAPTVDAALPMLESDTWDAVLVDPGPAGGEEIEVIERLHRHSPEVPIIALVDAEVEEEAAELIRAGAQECIARPRLDGSLLRHTVRCAVERARHGAADRAAEALTTRHTNFEAIVNRSPAVLIVWRVADGYYPVEFVSENIRLFGYTAEEIMAAEDPWGEITHPDDVARIRSEVADYFNRGVWEFSQHYRIRTKSGELRWIEDRNLALPDSSGRVTHVQGMLLDVTDERMAQKRYEDSQDKLCAISDAALDAVILMDTEGRIAHWNPAAERMFGWRRDEIFGRSVHDVLMPPEYRDRANERLRQFAVTGTGPAVGKVLELSAFHKDGSRFPIEISVAPIRLEQGWGAVGIIRDITKRKWAEDAVARQQRQLRKALDLHERDCALLADEIHDGFVQPLAGALMNLEASLVELQAHVSPAARQQYVSATELFRNTIRRARQLMSRLRPSILDQFGLVSAIESLVDQVRENDGPAVTCSYEMKPQRLAAPLEIALYRVVQEGLTNARMHAKCGHVRLRIGQEESTLRVEIEDDGIGFNPDEVGEGCFGLEGIRQRAKVFGGQAVIQSAPGAGTRILFELPLVEAAPGGDESLPDDA